MGAKTQVGIDEIVHPPVSKNVVARPNADELKASKVLEFYKDKTILITGATGFLGKVLLWKLIDTCPNFKTIYLLLRPKKDQPADQRLAQMLKGKPFNFDPNYEAALKKVVAIESDMSARGLGLSKADRELIENEVNLVFHSAASVKFDAPLKDNMRDNVSGTKALLELCDNIKDLKALVHVSTAYCNCHKTNIREDIEPLERQVDDVMTIVETLPDEACNAITDKLVEGRPNTYTYTKAMAEQFVAMREGKYPLSIVRPSIVISSAQEPCPGWVDNVNGIAGLGCLASIGLLRTIDWDSYATADMIPVDYVANCMLCAAYESYTNSPKRMKIYNLSSGNLQPMSWGSFFAMLRATAVKTPPNKIVRPMIRSPRYRRANPIKLNLIKIFSEILFAYLVDFLISLFGYKRIMVKITKKMHHGYKILRPFTTREWNFFSDNVIGLTDSLPPVDKKLFKFDMRNFDWRSQAELIWYGVREFIIKEEHTQRSYESARKRQLFVTFIHHTLTVMFFGLMALICYANSRAFLSDMYNRHLIQV